MRPVNLIPPDARRGDRATMRTGVVSYLVLGALALGLLGAIALGVTSKQISDRESEQAQLQQDLEAATARAQSVSAFARFRAMQESRTATVSSLAQSRFDWKRVLEELALVIPADVWLVELTGTVNPAVDVEGGADVSIRDSVSGPALEIIGCATGQDAVAGFVADLEDIDGVTRVGVNSSQLPDREEEEAQEASAAAITADPTSDTGGDCRTRRFISRFEIVVAFDEVPVPETATAAPSVPAPLAPPATPGTDGPQLAGAETQSGSATPSTDQAQAGTGG